MDLGIAGRRALLAGSSAGLGKACAAALSAEGVDVVVNGRDGDRLNATVEELRATARGSVTGVVADVTTKEGRAALLEALPDPDILLTNSAGPPPGAFYDYDEEDWLRTANGTMVAPLALIKATIGPMRERKFGRIVNITSAMVGTPRPHMGLSSSARAGLTAVVAGLSLEVAADNVTINNLLPERFDTDRGAFMAKKLAERRGVPLEQARAEAASTIAAKRFGRPEEFGATCAFVCSVHASYMSGMNIRLDGGSYPGLL